MADSNLVVFSKIEERTFAFTSDRFMDKTDYIGKSLEGEAEAVTNKFFTLMAQRGKFIDTEKSNGIASSYPDISESHWDQKARRGLVNGAPGGENRFYFYTGALENSLAGVRLGETSRILGRSRFKGLRSDKFSDKQTVFRYGRGSVVGGKKVGGQFGRISDINTTIAIDLFSKVNTTSDLNPLIKSSGKAWAEKLAVLDGGRGGSRPIPARPMLAAYYTWFLEVEVPKHFLSNIRRTKWRGFSE